MSYNLGSKKRTFIYLVRQIYGFFSLIKMSAEFIELKIIAVSDLRIFVSAKSIISIQKTAHNQIKNTLYVVLKDWFYEEDNK